AQEDEDDQHHQHDGDQQRRLHVLDGGADGQGGIAGNLGLDRRWNRGDQSWQLCLDPVDGFDDVGAGLLEDDEQHAPLAVGPGGLLYVFRPGHRRADVADSQRAPVAVGDDDVVPVLWVQHLIVGVNRIGAGDAVDVPLRTVNRRNRDLISDVLQRQALGDQLRGVDLNPNRRLLLAADKYLRHTRDLADLLRELGVDGGA